MKKICKLIFSRLFIVVLGMAIQFFWLLNLLYRFSYHFTFVNLGLRILAIIIALRIVSRWMNPSYKLAWTFIILMSPVLGLLIYFVFGRSELTKRTKVKLARVHEEIVPLLVQNPDYQKELEEIDPIVASQSAYLSDWAQFPVYKKTATEYYPCGEEMFPKMLEAMEGAKEYIFLEYFILEYGIMFDRVIEVLERKVKEGVDVRLIYDDVGCVTTLPANFYVDLQKKGIKCAAFNPFRPVLSIIMNNRDHRKILVVDGNIAFTGGINIADEYINKKERFGYWKDTGIRLEGEAVWSFTCMFLEMWNYITHSTEDYLRYRPKELSELPFRTDGFVQPYGDTPLDKENTSENVYMNIINKARRYVYIFTPYLIMDQELLISLCNAAKCGVDVRIITPGIPDKKMIYLLTQADYQRLIENGVKIYQYTPGFLHAKCFVSDDAIATVGSINLDYRSLYLHFECGVFLYQSDAVMQVKKDMEETMAQSEQVTLEFCRHRALPIRLMQSVLRLLAPLL
ncbi:MAG: cardiolipin synthase [Lachnospiraceae bacterium]|nr:cardiolipin synthase [Lachnospiraceae bacterium]